MKCPSLTSLFPLSVARKLVNLEELRIVDCGVEEIISKEGGLEATSKFAFID